jgi:hypothetical protein
MPAFKLSTIGTGKGAGAKAADGSALPVTVIDHVLDFRFFSARILQRLANGTPPRYLWNHIARQDRSSRHNHQ